MAKTAKYVGILPVILCTCSFLLEKAFINARYPTETHSKVIRKHVIITREAILMQ